MQTIAIPIIIKSYVKIFENLSLLGDIDERVNSYFEIDAELEKDFNQLVKFARTDGWKFSPSNQIKLANDIRMICEMRKDLTDLMVRDIERL